MFNPLKTQFFHPLFTNLLYWARWAHNPTLVGLGYALWPYRDNYSKPTCGMACFHFAFPWFNHLHFVLLKLLLLGLCYPPLASSVKKQLLPPKYNITRIKKLEFGFFLKELGFCVSMQITSPLLKFLWKIIKKGRRQERYDCLWWTIKKSLHCDLF